MNDANIAQHSFFAIALASNIQFMSNIQTNLTQSNVRQQFALC